MSDPTIRPYTVCIRQRGVGGPYQLVMMYPDKHEVVMEEHRNFKVAKGAKIRMEAIRDGHPLPF